MPSSAYLTAATQHVTAADVDYAYRDVGPRDAATLLLLQHFRGNLDNWDSALIDALAADRRVITFDNRGVAATSGTTPSTIAAMAHDALAFLTALGLDNVDVLGFSIGSFVAQQLALQRPDTVRRLILAAAAPEGAAGMHGWPGPVIDAVGRPEPGPEQYLGVFFTQTESSAAAGVEAAGRIFGGRATDRDVPTDWHTRLAQYDAVCAWGIPDHGKLQRLTAITAPTLVTAGDSDPMILPRYSHLLAGLIPDATVKIYPDAAHGFLFQHHAEFAADVHAFLS